MGKSRLITASLVSSVKWAQVCPESWKERAHKSLHNTLARVWDKPNEAAERGIAFEKYLYKVLGEKTEPDHIDCSSEFRSIVHKYYKKPIEIQKKVKRFITLHDYEYCLYGKLDILYSDPSYIEDIKTTMKQMDDYRKKYLDGFQHHLYCFITDLEDFQYFVVVFNEFTKKISKTVEVHYHVEDWIKEREIVEETIDNTLTYLGKNPTLFKLYADKFCLY